MNPEQLSEIRRALVPFSRLSDMVGLAWTDDTPAFVCRNIPISIGELRAAARALGVIEAALKDGDKATTAQHEEGGA